MPLLIDGYNLLHVTGIFGRGNDQTVLHRSRMALLHFLATAINEKERVQTTIVFDAAGAPPGLPRTVVHEGITVHFARGYADADAMIEELLEKHIAPRSLVVVSSDHRVQRYARRRGAKTIDSNQWYTELRTAQRASQASSKHSSVKPMGALSPDEVNYWLEEFSEPLPEIDSGRSIPLAQPTTSADNAAPTSNDSAADESSDADQEKPTDDFVNPFPPGYAEDLLDESD